MEQRQRKSSLVLKYAKRRFDGGNEAELIEVIERQQAVEQLNKLYRHSENTNYNFSAPLSLAPSAVVPPKVEEPSEPSTVRYSKVSEVILRGPLQVCIGLVGILTAGLAIVTFRRHKNDAMLAQSQAVLGECVKSLRKGFWDTIVSPIKVLQSVLKKA